MRIALELSLIGLHQVVQQPVDVQGGVKRRMAIRSEFQYHSLLVRLREIHLLMQFHRQPQILTSLKLILQIILPLITRILRRDMHHLVIRCMSKLALDPQLFTRLADVLDRPGLGVIDFAGGFFPKGLDEVFVAGVDRGGEVTGRAAGFAGLDFAGFAEDDGEAVFEELAGGAQRAYQMQFWFL